uniref:Heat shock protein 67B2 n=1 Tax=Schistocephalus solidus TaxID=70667 RepID=A0A0V0J5K9_SCHSO
MSSFLRRSPVFASAGCKVFSLKNPPTSPQSYSFYTPSVTQTRRISAINLRSTHTPAQSFGLSPSELKKMLNKSEVLLIDVRNPEEIQKNGRIEGSVNIPFESLKGALDLTGDAFRTQYGFDRRRLHTSPLVFICKVGIRSMKALNISKEFGIKEAFILSGGFDAWKTEEN